MQCMIGMIEDQDITLPDLLKKMAAADPAKKIQAKLLLDNAIIDPESKAIIDEMKAAVERDIG